MSFEHSTATMDGVVYSTTPQTAKKDKENRKENKTALERALAKKIIGYELTDYEKELLARAEAKGILFGEQ